MSIESNSDLPSLPYWVCLLVNLTNGAKTTEIIVSTDPNRILIEKNHQNKQSVLNIFVVVMRVGPFESSEIADKFHKNWSKQSRGSASRMKKGLSLLENGNFHQASDGSQNEIKVSVTIIPFLKSDLTKTILDMKNHAPVCVRKDIYNPVNGASCSTLYQLCSSLAPILKIQSRPSTKLISETIQTDRTHHHNVEVKTKVRANHHYKSGHNLDCSCDGQYKFKPAPIKKNNNATTCYQPKLVIVKRKRKYQYLGGERQEKGQHNKRRRLGENIDAEHYQYGKVCTCEFRMIYPSYYKKMKQDRDFPVNGICLLEKSGDLLYSLGDMTIQELSKMKM